MRPGYRIGGDPKGRGRLLDRWSHARAAGRTLAGPPGGHKRAVVAHRRAPHGPDVIVYSDSDVAGWSAEIPVGFHRSVPAGNDLVSSAIVPAGHRVTLCKDGPFKGDVLELTQGAASLGRFNDTASSIIVDRLADRAPTLDELEEIVAKVGPRIYFHPDDDFGPSSVEWFLNRATLHQNDGSVRNASDKPLPAGGRDDGVYWLYRVRPCDAR